MPTVDVRSLHRDDDLASFRSGHKDLDRFLVKYAARNHFDLKLARTYVAIADARVRGYVTLTGGALRGVELPGDDALGFPGYPLPVVVLARLAVSADLQRGGVGQQLRRFPPSTPSSGSQSFWARGAPCVGM